jgi:hypothetical protein
MKMAQRQLAAASAASKYRHQPASAWRQHQRHGGGMAIRKWRNNGGAMAKNGINGGVGGEISKWQSA